MKALFDLPLMLRPAKPGEGELLSELGVRSKATWGYDEAFISACRDELRVQPSDILHEAADYIVAERAGRVVGYYALVRLADGELELDALFVEPECIGQGVGHRLFTHALAVAGSRGASVLIQSDPHAADFYASHGARPFGERESDSIPGRFLPLMRVSRESVADTSGAASRLFVYGTLAPGQRHEDQLSMLRGYWEPATAAGRLITIASGESAGYPGLIVGMHPDTERDADGGKVQGLVFCSDELSHHWARLDRFEGVAYRRVVMEVSLCAGRRAQAQVYECIDR